MRRITQFQIDVLREGHAAGLTRDEAAYYAGISECSAEKISRRLGLRWQWHKVVPLNSERRLREMMCTVSILPLAQKLLRLATEQRLFVAES